MKALGDATYLWLDESRLPNAHSVRAFVDGIGILQSATPGHLADRILEIADESQPTDDAKRASSEAFYVLCDTYDQWKEDVRFRKAIGNLRNKDCLPAQGDVENWHAPRSLYAPYRADAFRSQAPILDFWTTARLKTDLLEALGITINPSTELVINHLKHCMELNVGPHVSTYQILNERAQADPDSLVSTLAGTPCIYVESQSKFVRTNQVYWVSQQLGRYAFTIPASIKSFTPLFKAIGVKDTPECSDYIDILLDIAGVHFERSAPVAGADRPSTTRALPTWRSRTIGTSMHRTICGVCGRHRPSSIWGAWQLTRTRSCSTTASGSPISSTGSLTGPCAGYPPRFAHWR